MEHSALEGVPGCPGFTSVAKEDKSVAPGPVHGGAIECAVVGEKRLQIRASGVGRDVADPEGVHRFTVAGGVLHRRLPHRIEGD